MKVEHPYLLGATILALLAYVLYQRSVKQQQLAAQGTNLYGPGVMGDTSGQSFPSITTSSSSGAIPNIVVTPNNVGTSS